MDPPAQLEEHNSVQSDGAELGQEDPDIMRPQSIGFECVVNPALCAHLSAMTSRDQSIAGQHTQAPDGVKTSTPP